MCSSSTMSPAAGGSSFLRGARGEVCVYDPPARAGTGGATIHLFKVPSCPVGRPVEPRGLEPRTSAVQGRRSPS